MKTIRGTSIVVGREADLEAFARRIEAETTARERARSVQVLRLATDLYHQREEALIASYEGNAKTLMEVNNALSEAIGQITCECGEEDCEILAWKRGIIARIEEWSA